MSLLDVVRVGVKVADGITKPLQATITYRRYGGEDAYGEKVLGSAVSMKAVVDWKQRQVRTQAGILSVSRASVLFLDTAQLLSVTNNQGINDEDQITLPDGTTGPILDMSGFIDAGTGVPVATEVFLG